MKLATKYKMYGAHLLYNAVRFFRVKRHQVKKIGDITYKLDLAEGIDLSLFLFGQFQKHVIPDGLDNSIACTVLDVGANVGIMSMQYASLFQNATVHAFEPSEYANKRFDDNLSLNPELARRWISCQEKALKVILFILDYHMKPLINT